MHYFVFKLSRKMCKYCILIVCLQQGTMIECNIAKCPNPQCQEKPANHIVKIQNQLTSCIRAHMHRYHEVRNTLINNRQSYKKSLQGLFVQGQMLLSVTRYFSEILLSCINFHLFQTIGLSL